MPSSNRKLIREGEEEEEAGEQYDPNLRILAEEEKEGEELQRTKDHCYLDMWMIFSKISEMT
jgi:hypothetical protein